MPNRSQGHLASADSYHLQQTPSRMQRLDGALSLHSPSVGGASSYGVTPSYADPYGPRLPPSMSLSISGQGSGQHGQPGSHHHSSSASASSGHHSSHQGGQDGGKMTRSATAASADPYQWYKTGTLGRNASRPMLRDIPLDVSFGADLGGQHPTAVVFPYRGQTPNPGASAHLQAQQHAALAAAAASAARYRGSTSAGYARDPGLDFRGAGYPIGYFAADLPSVATAAAISTTPRRVSSDIYPRSPPHLRAACVDPSFLSANGGGGSSGASGLVAKRTLADVAGLSHSNLLRTVSSDKGPLSVHDIAAAAAVAQQGEKQKIAVVKPIKQQASSNSGQGLGMGSDRRCVTMYSALILDLYTPIETPTLIAYMTNSIY